MQKKAGEKLFLCSRRPNTKFSQSFKSLKKKKKNS